VVDKYRTGFQIPGPIPFEDLSNGPSVNSNNVINTPESRTQKNTVKSGTLGGGKKKNRGGLFKIFGNSNVSIYGINGVFAVLCQNDNVISIIFKRCLLK